MKLTTDAFLTTIQSGRNRHLPQGLERVEFMCLHLPIEGEIP